MNTEQITTLELISKEPFEGPFEFKSLGVKSLNPRVYTESAGFPKNQVFELIGIFPFPPTYSASNGDLHNPNKTHTLGGKTVKIVKYNIACNANQLNKFGTCNIHVKIVDNQNMGNVSPGFSGMWCFIYTMAFS